MRTQNSLGFFVFAYSNAHEYMKTQLRQTQHVKKEFAPVEHSNAAKFSRHKCSHKQKFHKNEYALFVCELANTIVPDTKH